MCIVYEKRYGGRERKRKRGRERGRERERGERVENYMYTEKRVGLVCMHTCTDKHRASKSY